MNDEAHDAEPGRQRGTIADVQRTVDRLLNMGRVLSYLDQVNLDFNAAIKPVMFSSFCTRTYEPLKTSEDSAPSCLFCCN